MIQKALLFIFLFCLISSCKQIEQKEKTESNDELIAKYCDIEIDKIAVVTTQDSNRIKHGLEYGCILGLKLFYSITNNSDKPVTIRLNSLFDDNSFIIKGELKGHYGFKFYPYPFMNTKWSMGYSNPINPGQSVRGDLSTPILEVLQSDRIPKTEIWLKDVDSIRIYMKSPTDSLFKKEFGRTNMKKEHIKIQYPCFDINPVDEL